MEIIRQKIFGHEVHDERAVNIVFGVDAPYVPMMGICMASLIKNNPARKISFHVFLSGIDERDELKIAELCDMFHATQITLYFLPPDLYKEIPILEKNYSSAIFYRIAAADFLSASLDKIIYMDADMLCLKPLDELLNLPLEKFLLAAVADKGEWIPTHRKNFGLRESHRYFNTGFLYVNLEFWRRKNFPKQVLNVLSEGKYFFPDQDAMNIVADRNAYPVEYISDRYNHFFRVDGKEQPLTDDVVIEHFAGQIKPWHPWCDSPLKEIYAAYQKISPWRDFVYLPRNYQECRLMGRVCRREGNWLEAFKWYWSYLKRRRVEKKS